MEDMEIKKVLITGSNGYIGSVLMKQLQKNKFFVKGIDTCYFSDALLDVIKFPFEKKDFRHITIKELRNYDAVIHLAGLSNDAAGELNPKLTEEINYISTVNLAKKAKKAGVKRFLFSSSCSIYGISKNGIVNERSKVNPLTHYSHSKFRAENDLLKLCSNTFCVSILRNSTVYGTSPYFRDDLIVNNLTASAVIHNQIRILSDGTPWRPLIDVRDLSNIFYVFLTANKNKINGEIINIGFSENNKRVNDIGLIIKHILPQCELLYLNEHGPDTRSYRVDFSKFNKLFPEIKQYWPLEKSIRDMINTIKDKKLNDKDFLGRFTRIKALKKLLTNNEITTRLYWRKK